MANIHNFDGFSIVQGDIQIHLKLNRFTDQFNRAQFMLDSRVMTSMVPFMPKDKSKLIDRTKIESASMAGTGIVYAGVAPYGRYLYMGKTMVDEKTGSPWAKKERKKVLVSEYSGKTNAKPDLTFSRGQPRWFEAAKKADGDEWIRETKRIAGGG